MTNNHAHQSQNIILQLVNQFLCLSLICSTLLVVPTATLYASNLDDEYEEITEKKEKKEKEYQSVSSKLADIRSKKDAIEGKITDLASQLNVTQNELQQLQEEINGVQQELTIINSNLLDRKTSLSEKIALKNQVIRDYAKQGTLTDLELFFSNNSLDLNGFEYATFSYMFENSLVSHTLSLVEILDKEIASFEADKAEAEALKGELEDAKNRLVAIKNKLDAEKNSAQGEFNVLAEEHSKTETKLKTLEEEIAKLSAEQQSILKKKEGEGNGTVGDYETPSQSLPDPKFKPAFAAFSYGAYTHRNGMSQYGAKGRASAGKDYKEILKFYYKTGVKTDKSFPSKISVKGYGEMDFQKYLYGIAEMPSDWPKDALKAQAIAARTYASRASKPICTTESCQVFLKSKSDNPPSAWKKAVDETKGMVLDGGSTAQYSSTTGGYINNVGWDTTGDWPGDAYEKKAKSPWFFKAWYTQNYSSNSSTCGLSNPWLDSEDLADILNAIVVWEKGTSDEKKRISPITTNCWGGNPYSQSDLAKKAEKYGKKYSKVTNVSVDISNSGYTSKVKLETDAGTVEIDGAKFKTVFNLRAPGYISIRNVLYDFVVKK